MIEHEYTILNNGRLGSQQSHYAGKKFTDNLEINNPGGSQAKNDSELSTDHWALAGTEGRQIGDVSISAVETLDTTVALPSTLEDLGRRDQARYPNRSGPRSYLRG